MMQNLFFHFISINLTNKSNGKSLKHFKRDKWFPLTLMEVLPPHLPTLDGNTCPQINISKNKIGSCLQSHLQACLPTHQKSYPKFQNPRTTFENPPFVRPNIAKCRGRGVPKMIWKRYPYNLIYIGVLAQFQKPSQHISGRNVKSPGKKNNTIVGQHMTYPSLIHLLDQ